MTTDIAARSSKRDSPKNSALPTKRPRSSAPWLQPHIAVLEVAPTHLQDES